MVNLTVENLANLTKMLHYFVSNKKEHLGEFFALQRIFFTRTVTAFCRCDGVKLKEMVFRFWTTDGTECKNSIRKVYSAHPQKKNDITVKRLLP